PEHEIVVAVGGDAAVFQPALVDELRKLLRLRGVALRVGLCREQRHRQAKSQHRAFHRAPPGRSSEPSLKMSPSTGPPWNSSSPMVAGNPLVRRKPPAVVVPITGSPSVQTRRKLPTAATPPPPAVVPFSTLRSSAATAPCSASSHARQAARRRDALERRRGFATLRAPKSSTMSSPGHPVTPAHACGRRTRSCTQTTGQLPLRARTIAQKGCDRPHRIVAVVTRQQMRRWPATAAGANAVKRESVHAFAMHARRLRGRIRVAVRGTAVHYRAKVRRIRAPTSPRRQRAAARPTVPVGRRTG